MWKLWATFILGIIVMIFSWLGFSPEVESTTIFILGLMVTVLSFLSARDRFIIMSHLNHEGGDDGEPTDSVEEVEEVVEEETVVPEQ